VLQGYSSNLLHEIIHVIFFSLVDNYTATNNPAIFNDFPTLFQKFVEHTYPGSIHHDRKWQIHMYAVALVLQEYNKSADPKMGLCHSKSTLIWPGRITELSLKKKHPIGGVEYNAV
jgi:hypothetical protein